MKHWLCEPVFLRLLLVQTGDSHDYFTYVDVNINEVIPAVTGHKVLLYYINIPILMEPGFLLFCFIVCLFWNECLQ